MSRLCPSGEGPPAQGPRLFPNALRDGALLARLIADVGGILSWLIVPKAPLVRLSRTGTVLGLMRRCLLPNGRLLMATKKAPWDCSPDALGISPLLAM